jgi:predicted nucleic acid-binding Zn ribbon protein
MSDQINSAVALSRIDSHEKVCAERYGEIKDSFGRVHGRIDWIMYTTILAALAAIGSLLMLVLSK